ncbi:MAG: hypothetical protein ACRC3B_11105, partial [Bacteroidia bacterium]
RYDAAYTVPGPKTFKLCLSAYAGQPNVRFAFDGISAGGGSLKLDDIRLYHSLAAVPGTASVSGGPVCSGNQLTLQLTGNVGTVQWQSAPISSPAAFTNIPGATSVSQPVTANSSAAFYRAMITNNDACTFIDYTPIVQATVYPLPVVNLGPDITACGQIVLNAQNAGSSYQWNNSTNAQTLTATSSGTYSVTVTNANNCAASDAINVTINPVPVVNLGADITQCGGTVMLDAQNAGSSYQWNNSTNAQTLTATSSGTYSVTVTNANNCSASDAINVTINPVPVVNLGADVVQCGGTVLLDAQNAGSSYQWNNSTNAQTLTAASSGTYSVTVTDASNCSASDAINVTINAIPVVNLGAD